VKMLGFKITITSALFFAISFLLASYGEHIKSEKLENFGVFAVGLSALSIIAGFLYTIWVG